jgi:hypothetical protein
VKTLKAPQKSITWSTATMPALLLLGVACGSAVASTEIQTPCPEAASQSDALHAILGSDDAKAPLMRPVEGNDSVSRAPLADSGVDLADDEADSSHDTVDSTVSESPIPEYTSRLPGVSASDMPRFRRHMFRTDI